jgi:hypothetical protein
MKITIKDKQGKEMVFDTLHEVFEVSCNNEKTFVCEEWVLIRGEKENEWFGVAEKSGGETPTEPIQPDLIQREIISNLEDKRRFCAATESKLIYTDAICTVKKAFKMVGNG